jgi:hypothetical protein
VLCVGKSPAPDVAILHFILHLILLLISQCPLTKQEFLFEILVSIASALLISEPLSPFLAVSLLLCPSFLLLYKMAAYTHD